MQVLSPVKTQGAKRRTLLWQPVNPQTKLPEVCESFLPVKDRSQVLYGRLCAFAQALVADKLVDVFEDDLRLVAESFLSEPVNTSCSPSHVPEKEVLWLNAWTDAVESLNKEFAGMIPLALWNTIVALGTRPEHHEEKSILDVQEHLPHPWYICDAALHALAKSYRLFLHVQARLSERTGTVLFHGCGCSHITSAPLEAKVEYTLPAEFREKVAQEFLDHFLSELYLIKCGGFPFRMNGLQTSKQALGL